MRNHPLANYLAEELAHVAGGTGTNYPSLQEKRKEQTERNLCHHTLVPPLIYKRLLRENKTQQSPLSVTDAEAVNVLENYEDSARMFLGPNEYLPALNK
jgi:hypothetical protein